MRERGVKIEKEIMGERKKEQEREWEREREGESGEVIDREAQR